MKLSVMDDHLGLERAGWRGTADVDWREVAGVPPPRSTVVMLAHDHKKSQLIDLAICYRDVLTEHNLVTTPTTGRLLHDMVGLTSANLSAGLDGNDEEIVACISAPSVSAVLFLVDPFRRAHEPSIEPVLRACAIHDVPLATNVGTAAAVLNWLSVLDAAANIPTLSLEEK